MANVRVQFSLKENILISKYTLSVLSRFDTEMAVGDRRPHIGHKAVGNLFMISDDERAAAEAAYLRQRQLGCEVQWWSPRNIHEQFPFFRTAGYAGGTFGPRDGYIDAYAMLMGYKAKAQALGADFFHDEAVGVSTHSGRVRGVQLRSGRSLKAPVVVNCTGAWAARFAQSVGIDLPIKPIKRQVFVVDPAVKPAKPLPLTVLPTGLYFRTDTGGHILIGKSMPEDPVGFDFTWDDKRFVDHLWPELAQFVPVFDTLKLVRGWAGLYAVNTLDSNAILGEWPELQGFYLANGFSGHGLQQAPAVGRHIAELILGKSPTLDLTVFDPLRVIENKPLSESSLV
jgi:glycine/D-amino acid oxidase-like deaminating enzyme